MVCNRIGNQADSTFSLEGETLDQVRDCCRWTRDHAYWAFYTLRAAMEEYLKIQ